jgi:predicted transcriptional regulator of viral defense system
MQTICRGGVEFSVKRDECQIVKNLDNHPKQLFGEHILLSSAKTEEKEQAKALAREQAQRNAQEAAQKRAGVLLENGMIPLSQRERRIVERLNQNK